MPTRWKVYFFLIALQAIGVPVGVIFWNSFQSMDLANWVFVTVGVAGLFGFVYRRPMLKQSFWKGFAPLFVLWDIFFILLWLPYTGSYTLGDGAEIQTFFIFLFAFPQYVGLFRYGYDGADIWTRGNAINQALQAEH